MKRSNFIKLLSIGSIACLLPLYNNPNPPTLEGYVAWFKKKYNCHPYGSYHGLVNAGELEGLRNDFAHDNPLLKNGYVSIEAWEKRKKQVLTEMKVISFEEYKRYIA